MLFPGLLSFYTVLNRVGATIIIIILKNSFFTRIESVVDVNIAFVFLVLANNRYITNEEVVLFFVNCRKMEISLCFVYGKTIFGFVLEKHKKRQNGYGHEVDVHFLGKESLCYQTELA